MKVSYFPLHYNFVQLNLLSPKKLSKFRLDALCACDKSWSTLCDFMMVAHRASVMVFPRQNTEWVTISYSRRSSSPRDQTHTSPESPALAGGLSPPEPLGKPSRLQSGWQLVRVGARSAVNAA